MKKSNKRALDGVLLLDKPFGLSSNTALQKARWLYHAQKAGHTGNLDPYATGLLPLCFGEATKFSQRWLDADKGYRATISFGATSTTGDAEGVITSTGHALPSELAIRAALAHFHGEIAQIPPMYSALKYKGKALYEYARRGEEIERAARPVTIKQLSWYEQIDEHTVLVDVLCTKGTYIRVLAEDIGHYLGCGAYLSGLRRTLTGSFTLAQALTLPQLEALDVEARDAYLLPVDILVAGLAQVFVEESQARQLLQGMPVSLTEKRDHEKSGQKAEYRLYVRSKAGDNAEFIGLGVIDVENRLRPSRMLAKAVAALTDAA